MPECGAQRRTGGVGWRSPPRSRGREAGELGIEAIHMREIKHWLDGAAIAGTSGRHLPVWDPATGEQQAYVVAATAAETNRAVASALKAFPAWRAAALSRRAEVMFRFRELVDANRKEIAALVSKEHAKTEADAGGELARGLENIEFPTGAPHLPNGGYREQ